MTTAVDTNIILDYLNPEEPHNEASTRALVQAGAIGPLTIGEATYAELAGQFQSGDEFDDFLATAGIRLSPSSRAALAMAGNAWMEYSRRRPSNLRCPACGANQDVSCRDCGTPIRTRQHIVADFLIGAHAVLHADRLLTRDRGFYRTYFPELRLVQ